MRTTQAGSEGQESGGAVHPAVLLVEDEDLVRELVRNILERSGFEVLEAATVEEAVRLGTGHPGHLDVMLCDVVMPGRSGPEIFREVEGHRPGLKVLYMSGYPLELIDRRGLLPDGVPFLQKPFSPDELEDRLMELVRG